MLRPIPCAPPVTTATLSLKSQRSVFKPENSIDVERQDHPLGQEFGQLDGIVGDALNSLSDSDRNVLVMRHVGELSLRELSEALETGESATKMRLYRAEERLRTAYHRLQRRANGDPQ